MGTGAAAAQAGSEIAAHVGRWVKLTEESAQKLKKYKLMKGSSSKSARAVLTEGGKSKGFLEIVKTPSSLLTNPSILAGVGGVMAQVAMQQAMDEITDYLATIDAKLDDVLRAQKDAVVADMIGVGLVIEEAMTIREHGGRVSEVTWSKVQGSSAAIARTQAYALRQLDALAEKMEQPSKVSDLAATVTKAEPTVREWLAVLARCFQLQDGIAVLELDRVMDSQPEALEGHRLGVKAARQKRLKTISQTTETLLARIDAAAGTANAKVLFHPSKSPEVVQSGIQISQTVTGFHGSLGIESDRQPVMARRWGDAASEVGSKALEAGSVGADAARRLGNDTLDRAKSAQTRLAEGIAGRSLRRRNKDKDLH